MRSFSHGEVTCHRSWTFPFVSQDLKSSQETPIMTVGLPDKMYPTILCLIKCLTTKAVKPSSLLASHSFDLLVYIFPFYGLVYCLLISYNMFNVWVLRSPFVLPSILPPYILPPKGELAYPICMVHYIWCLVFGIKLVPVVVPWSTTRVPPVSFLPCLVAEF